ncbi:MAG: hypothetical protein ACJAYG_000955 [Oceanicoccus sp.]|jgi:hypothetical protein
MTIRINRSSQAQFCIASEGVGYQPMQLNSAEHGGNPATQHPTKTNSQHSKQRSEFAS